MLLEQFAQDPVVRQSQAYGLARRMAQTPGHLPAGVEDEGIGPGCHGLEQTELPVVDTGIAGQLAQIAAQQGQVMALIDTPDTPQAVGRRFIVEVTNQGIARVRGYREQPALSQQLAGPSEQTPLRVVGMDFKQLGHECEGSKPSLGPPQTCSKAAWAAARLARDCLRLSQAPPAPQAPMTHIPISDPPSGVCENTSHPPITAKAICAYI